MMRHQVESYEKLIDLDRTFDMSDPGCGKTLVALAMVKARNVRALVVCPKTLMEVAWVDDARKFFPDLMVIPSYAPHKLITFDAPAHIFVINVDAAKWLAVQNKKFFDKFDMIIFDESSKFKHRTSQRSKAIKKVSSQFQLRHAMSGTPMSQHITNIWHQMYIIDDGQRLGNRFFQFQNAVCTPVQTGPLPQHRNWVARPGAEEVIAGRLMDISVRNKFEDCIDIPETYTRNLQIHLKPKHKGIYEEMKRNAVLEFRDGKVNAVNAAVLRGKLLQIVSGAVYDTNGNYKVIDGWRYELTTELIAERDHSLVFFLWDHQKDLLIKNLKGISYEVIDGTVNQKERTKIIRRYEKGDYQTLLLHPETASYGITLVRADTAIWASPTDRVEWSIQGYRRMVRAGQTKKTETILITANDTLEKKVYTAMEGKKDLLDNFLELVE